MSGWRSLPFPRRGMWCWRESNLSWKSVIASSWPHRPPLIRSSPICPFFFLLSLMFYLNSSTLLLLCTLSPSFFFPPSFLGYLLTTSLCHIYLCWSNVAGEVCLSRRWQETGDSDACLVLCLLALSEQEKLHWGFWHLKGVERVTGLHEGDVSGKTKARRESETVAVALSFLDTNRGLLGSGTT